MIGKGRMSETTAQEIGKGKLGQIVHETMTMERYEAVKRLAKEFGMVVTNAGQAKKYPNEDRTSRVVETATARDYSSQTVPVGNVHVRIENPTGHDWAEFWKEVDKQEVAPPAHI